MIWVHISHDLFVIHIESVYDGIKFTLFQDTYYHEDDSIHHIKDKKTNLINWEVLEAFNMEKMHLDINHIRQKV